jgi:hypothetical protein
VARDFGLALAENLHEITDADFAASHQVEQAQACGIGQGGKKAGQGYGFGEAAHTSIVYGLTNMYVAHIFAKTNVRYEQ